MNLNIVIKQETTLSPKTLQALHILQMDSQELLHFIHETAYENPTLDLLEHTEKRCEPGERLSRRDRDGLADTGRHENIRARGESGGGGGFREMNQADGGQRETLFEHIIFQVRQLKLPQKLEQILTALAACLDENGYLTEAPAALAAEWACPKELVEEGLSILQTLQPAGVGARSLSECLCLQLKALNMADSTAMELARVYLDKLATRCYGVIAKQMGVTSAEVHAAFAVIRTLNPRPCAEFARQDSIQYVVPDVIIERAGSSWDVRVNSDEMPVLTVNSYYQNLYQRTESREVRDYLSEKLQQAKWLIKTIDQRYSTLLALTRGLVSIQSRFLSEGPEYLEPMTLSSLAEILGIHESTVSRAIKNKFVQCPAGVFPFSYFFSGSLSRSTPPEGGKGAAVSSVKVKALLSKLIRDEERSAPLSDQKLCDQINAEGIEISRRTVAKYRIELGIPSAAARKIELP